MKSSVKISILFFLFFQINLVTAQEAKWSIGAGALFQGIKLQTTNNLYVESNKEQKVAFSNIPIHVSRRFGRKIEIGIGYGTNRIDYNLPVDVSVHQLNNRIRFRDPVDRNKESAIVKEVQIRQRFHHIPLFIKAKSYKNGQPGCRPSIGLRVDSYFSRSKEVSARYTYPGSDYSAGDLIGSIIVGVITGNWSDVGGSGEPSKERDPVTVGQKNEILNYYANTAQNRFTILSPMIGLEWYYPRASWGFDLLFNLPLSEINSLTENSRRVGLSVYFNIHIGNGK